MSKPKYLYIDDENDSSIQSIINGFNDLGIIEVEYFPLSEFKEFGNLRNEIIERKRSNGFDGIVVDLRLDGDGPDKVQFNATSITQELRSITARGDINSFPIILCSTEPKIRETYDSDKSSHDLFDYKFEKSIHPNYPKFTQKLYSLAMGYSLLNENMKKITLILGREDITQIDPRIFERFMDDEIKKVVYDIAHFIVKNLFHNTNPLLKERIVAARLGIDIEASGKNWDTLKENILTPAKYVGLFSEGWERWWADSIVGIFKNLTDKKLSFLGSDERVELIIEKTGIKGLIAAKPLPRCKSSEFWTICEGYKRPLDPLEGFKIFSSVEPKPWQESKYLSFDAIIERIGIEKGLRPHSSELSRIEAQKQNML